MTRGRLTILATIGVVLIVCSGLATATLLRARAPSGGLTQARLSQKLLEYPEDYARFGPGRTGGMLDRIELAFTFPDLRGAGAVAAALPSDDTIAPEASQTVFLTLRPEDETADPAERTETLYGRFLQSDVWQEENGLIMRRFEAGSPYEREELHFVPPEGRVFAARCMRPTQPPSDLPSTCLSALRFDGLDIDVRFSPTLLPRWDALSSDVRRLVQTFVRN